MSTPPEKLAESIGHMCQTCGETLADIAVVNLRTGETDIQCYPCNVAMMTAVLADVAAQYTAEGTEDYAGAAQRAAEAAAAALAAE